MGFPNKHDSPPPQLPLHIHRETLTDRKHTQTQTDYYCYHYYCHYYFYYYCDLTRVHE